MILEITEKFHELAKPLLEVIAQFVQKEPVYFNQAEITYLIPFKATGEVVEMIAFKAVSSEEEILPYLQDPKICAYVFHNDKGEPTAKRFIDVEFDPFLESLVYRLPNGDTMSTPLETGEQIIDRRGEIIFEKPDELVTFADDNLDFPDSNPNPPPPPEYKN